MEPQESDQIILKGLLLPEELSDNKKARQVMVEENKVIDVPLKLTDFLEFTSKLRMYSEVLDWVRKAGGDREGLDALIGSGRLVRIGNLEGAKYIHEFNGLRLVPLGYPVSLNDPESTTVWIAETPESTMQLPISERTANLLWSNEPGEDIPATAIRIASEAGDDLEIWGRSLKFDLPALIENRLAWLSEVSK